jgi:NAD(P)-dependent dehydrogenase (short-subunit alcohol dehydrogenase family)
MTNNDRIDTGYTWETTTDQVLENVDLTGKRAIVTGASSGIGVETARALASKGAAVTLAVRNVEKGDGVVATIREQTGAAVDVRELELGDLDSVRAFVAKWEGPLDILVNNAGVMNLPTRELTPQGWEKQFGTNHLGHFALTLGLLENLKVAKDGARVVSVASGAHHFGGVDFDDINFENRPYGGWPAYGQSKTANILFAVEAAKRWAGDDISINSLHPGNIRTELHRHIEFTPETEATFNEAQWKTVEQGAATSVLLAASPVIDGITGRYFEDVNEAVEVATPGVSGVMDYALDEPSATRLWDLSAEAVRA